MKASRVACVDSAKARYARDVEAIRKAGGLDPKVYPSSCGRCGGDVTVFSRVAPQKSASASVDIKSIPICSVCRVDNVVFWGDLIRIARAKGLDYRGGLDLETMTHRPTARELERIGLVRYAPDDGAWKLTAKGEELLAEEDQ